MACRQVPTFGQSDYLNYVDNLIINDDNISECNCVTVMSRSYRENFLEQPLLEKIDNVFIYKKNLVIYSLGSGGCGQELSICMQLAEKNWAIKHFILVDRDYTDLKRDKRVIAFTKYFNMLFPGNTQVSVYRKEKDYVAAVKASKDPLPDVILCVDIGDGGHSKLDFRNDCKTLLGDNKNPCITAFYNTDPSDDDTLIDEIVEIN